MVAGVIIVGDTRSGRFAYQIMSTLVDSTVSATIIIEPENYREYTSTCDNYADLDVECEQIEIEKIIRYAVIWSLIAYAVALRKSVERRSRAPPNFI